VKNILNEYKNARFHIDGHTDSVGRDASNQTLSEGRAAAVVTWLTANGISADRLVARGFGETQPLVSNDTKDGRATNRRVEINLIPRN
jgi:outer membrane protein OmpA-like peptidoglycan-associated protein